MFRIEDQRLLETPTSPRELVSSEPSVPNPDVQLYRVRIERESLPKYIERLIVLTFVVQLMGALIVLFGTQEWGRHISNNLQLMSVCLLYYAYSLEFNTR
jgi:hypothetical protein